ncbi:AraC family transcriptional regulator [Radiobacillus sp. PE A8.2]|uniref:AraC family transcriptional regulator n=1 Tax=Radiobacillus sp. PE A8.2 TaxID=3380349 RepID=UPI00388ED0E1
MEVYGVNVLWTARYDYENGNKLPKHAHSFFQIIWVAEGKGTFHYEDDDYDISRNTMFFIKPNKKHGITPMDGQSIKTLDLKFDVTAKELGEVTDRIPPILKDTDGIVSALLDNVRKEGLKKQAFYKQLASLYLVQMVYQLSRTSLKRENHHISLEPGIFALKSDRSYKAAEQVEQWIKEHFNQDWLIADIARDLGYSVGHLSQLFKNYKGTTICVFLKKYRIGQSKELMTYSELTLKQIAEQTGFKTVHHFSKVFKEIEGIPPGQWLERERRGICKDVVFD